MKTAALVALTGVIGQGLSAVLGLLVARWMGVDEYAVYTIGLSLLGSVAVLSKCGTQTSLVAHLGQVWPSVKATRQIIQSISEFRVKASLTLLPITILIGCCLVYSVRRSWWDTCFFGCVLAISWACEMRFTISAQLLYFDQKALQVQYSELVATFGRISAVVMLHLLTSLGSIALLLSTSVLSFVRIPLTSRAVSRISLKETSAAMVDWRKEIRKSASRQLPIDVFFCVQSQVIFVALSMFGTVQNIAAMGAILRIGQLLVPLGLLMQTHASPKMARASVQETNRLTGRILLLLSLPLAMFVIVARLIPEVPLTLIGPHYASYTREFFVASVSICISILVTAFSTLVAARGWNRFSLVQIPITVIWCFCAPRIFDLNNLTEVFYFHMGFPLGLLVSSSLDFFFGQRAQAQTKELAE